MFALCLIFFVALYQTHADNISMVIVAIHPGLYNPKHLLPTDGRNGDWAWENSDQLNQFGKKQSLAFGTYLRERYSSILSRDYFSHEFLGVSASQEKCQQTLLTTYAGLYKLTPKATFDFDLHWQPIPLKIEDDAMGISAMECSHYDMLRHNFLNNSEMLQSYPGLSELSIYLAKNSGSDASFNGMVDVIDNWRAMKIAGVSMPSYLERPTLANYTSDNLYQKLLSVKAVSNSICANDTVCRHFASWTWLSKIMKVISAKNKGTTDKSMIINVAETDNLISLLTTLKLSNCTMSSTSGILIEVRNEPAAVRVICHNLGNEIDFAQSKIRKINYQRLPYCDYMEWCPLDMFAKYVSEEVGSSQPQCNFSPGIAQQVHRLLLLLPILAILKFIYFVMY